MRSTDIGELVGGPSGNELDRAVSGAIRDVIELNELLDKQRERRESEARSRTLANKR